jgi:hypothetical protein
MMNRKLDKDISAMTPGGCAQELMRVRQIIRRHKKFRDHERCHYNDDDLYTRTLPEGAVGAGMMSLPLPVLQKGCRHHHSRNGMKMSPRCEGYIRRQKFRLEARRKNRRKR